MRVIQRVLRPARTALRHQPLLLDVHRRLRVLAFRAQQVLFDESIIDKVRRSGRASELIGGMHVRAERRELTCQVTWEANHSCVVLSESSSSPCLYRAQHTSTLLLLKKSWVINKCIPSSGTRSDLATSSRLKMFVLTPLSLLSCLRIIFGILYLQRDEKRKLGIFKRFWGGCLPVVWVLYVRRDINFAAWHLLGVYSLINT